MINKLYLLFVLIFQFWNIHLAKSEKLSFLRENTSPPPARGTTVCDDCNWGRTKGFPTVGETVSEEYWDDCGGECVGQYQGSDSKTPIFYKGICIHPRNSFDCTCGIGGRPVTRKPPIENQVSFFEACVRGYIHKYKYGQNLGPSLEEIREACRAAAPRGYTDDDFWRAVEIISGGAKPPPIITEVPPR